jgi:hypothetical protein
MIKSIVGALVLLLPFVFYGQQTHISGRTTGFVGKKIQFYISQDYFSYKDSLIGEAHIEKDSTFNVYLPLTTTQQIHIKCAKNTGFIYAEPGKNYSISLPDKDPYNAYRPQGNRIEIAFLSLPKTDINYKILEFDNWMNDFLGVYFNRKATSTLEFAQQLDTFKLNVEKYYRKDTNFFFQTYIRYSIASMEDIQFSGSKTRMEKFQLYLKDLPVCYENNIYINYFSLFYKNIFALLSNDINIKIYKSILGSSPTLLMRNLGVEATLRNPRVRELVAIQGLSEVYNGKDYPKSNIITILDSISRFGLYKQNRLVARNIVSRLTELSSGMKAPNFEILLDNNDTVSLGSFSGKYIYIQFIDPSIEESKKQVELLKPLYEKYKSTFQFVSIIDVHTDLSKEKKSYYATLPWKSYFVASTHPIFSKYNIKSSPTYVLIDDTGVLHSYPAAGPIPDGEYETVEKVLYTIKRKIELEKLNREKSGFDDIYDDTK